VLKNRIPENILKRPKQAYRAPINSVFQSKDAPEYVKYMLSDTYTSKVGVFNYNSIAGLISKIEKTGTSSEIENMVLSSVISTHLLYYQFIENNNKEFPTKELAKLKIVSDQ
jgi:asparagine synthase (glutamine-hydrolysing)